MPIKKFVAPSLPEALAKARDNLGEDAVVLKTRLNNKGAGPGTEGTSVEITASSEKPKNAGPSKSRSERIRIPSVGSRLRSVPARPVRTPVETFQDVGEILAEMRDEIRALREDVAASRSRSLFWQPSGSLLEVGRALMRNHLPEDIAIDLLKRIPSADILDLDALWTQIISRLAKMLGESRPIKVTREGVTVVMLVGPPGSGKTSAAARLAFKFITEETSAASLISADNFRADSPRQLGALADVIGCPFTAVSSPQELRAYLDTVKSGLVLIDTSGCSAKTKDEALARMIAAAEPHEIHLVVPAGTPAGEISDFIRHNPDVAVNGLFVTRLDQTSRRGGIIGAALESGLSFSYQVSTRELPGDIDLFDPEDFVSTLRPPAPQSLKTNRVRGEEEI